MNPYDIYDIDDVNDPDTIREKIRLIENLSRFGNASIDANEILEILKERLRKLDGG